MVETYEVELAAKQLVMYIEKLKKGLGGRVALEDAPLDAAERKVVRVEKKQNALEEVTSHYSELVRKYKKPKLNRESQDATDQVIIV